MNHRTKRMMFSLAAVALLGGSALLFGSRASAFTCTSLFIPGNILCPGSPSPGYHLVGVDGKPQQGQVAVYYGEGSSTNWRVECKDGSGHVFVDHGATGSFSRACPADKQYIKLLRCGDDASCQN